MIRVFAKKVLLPIVVLVGVLFCVNSKVFFADDAYTKLYSFDTPTGSGPTGGMVYVAQTNKLYGTTTGGGANGMGVLFSYNPEADNYVALYSFDAQSGNKSSGPLIYVADNHKLYGMMSEGGAAEAPNVASGTIFSYDVISETFEVLYTFGADDNVQYNPVGSLAYQPSQGMLYGATSKGGITDQGVLFSFDISGSTYT